MPVYSLNDQGWFDGSRAIMQGIAGYRQKKQQDRENKWHDDEFGLQRQKLDFDRESTQQRNALDQSRFEEDKKNYEINRQLMQKKLGPITQFDPAQHVKTLPDGTQVIVDPETGTPTKVIEKNPMVDLIKGMVTQPGAQPSTGGGLPPEGTNTVLAPFSGTPELPVQQPQGAGPSPVMTGFSSTGPTFQMRHPIEPDTIVERDVPGHGKQTFLRSVDPSTGKEKLEPYRVSESSNKIGDEALNKLNVLSLVMSQLPELEKAINDAGDAGGPLAGRLAGAMDAVGGTPNPHQMAFSSLESRMLAPIAKGVLGETGALSKDDMVRYAPLLPNYKDTQEARQYKLNALRNLVSEQRDKTMQNLKATGRDTSALEVSPSLQPPKPSVQALMQDAQRAIRSGADIEKVKQRLLENGVPPEQVATLK